MNAARAPTSGAGRSAETISPSRCGSVRSEFIVSGECSEKNSVRSFQ